MKICTRTVVKTVTETYVEMTTEELVALESLVAQFKALDRHQHCFYCGIATPNQKERSKDHFIPQSIGYVGKRRPVVNSCHPCNRAKGPMLPDEFRARRYAGKNVEFYG